MQGNVVKILGWMNRRTVMMGKDSEVPRCSALLALLSTEYSNNSQKHMRAVPSVHPTLAYPLDNRGSTVHTYIHTYIHTYFSLCYNNGISVALPVLTYNS